MSSHVRLAATALLPSVLTFTLLRADQSPLPLAPGMLPAMPPSLFLPAFAAGVACLILLRRRRGL